MNFITTSLLTAATCLIAAHAVAQPGTLDPSFNGDGIQVLQPGAVHDVGYDVIALADTTSLVCGVTSIGGAPTAFVAHLMQDGSLDPTYGTNAGYTFLSAGLETYTYSMSLAADGSLYLGGLTYITFAQSEVLLAHLDENGNPDAGFGTGGMVHTPVGTLDAEAKGLAIQDDGKIVLGGSVVDTLDFTRDILFLRYLPDGTIDSTFSDDGIQQASAYTSEDLLNDIDILDDGSIVGAGYADIIGDMKTILARVDANGEFVNAFGGDGVLVPGFGVTQDRAFGILADGQHFLVTGSFMDDPSNDDIYLARFNDDGTLDPGFGTGGVTLTDTDENEVGFDIAGQADGKWVLCGTTGDYGFGAIPRDFLVARFSSVGIADAGFGTAGVAITSIQSDFDDANALAIQPDGKILAAGFTSGFSLGTANDLALVRYLGDGTTGIAPAIADADIMIFPNPAHSGTVQVNVASGAPAEITVVDAQGREIMSRMTTTPGQPVLISADALETGAYNVRIMQGERMIVRPLMVVR